MSNKYKLTQQAQKQRIIYEVWETDRKTWQPVPGNHLYRKIKERLAGLDGKTAFLLIRLKNLPGYILEQLITLADVQTDFDEYVKITVATAGLFLEMRTSRNFDKDMENAYKTDLKASTDNFEALLQMRVE